MHPFRCNQAVDDLYPRIVFNRLVTSAEWSPEDSSYAILSEDIVTGERFSTTAKIVISAIGILELPKFPDIAGVSSFKGPMFHSARWDTGVDLRGKKVAVIGNGASATQFVPVISEDPAVEITEFCRTPNWFLPPIREDYSPRWKWTFRHVPAAMKLYRFYLYARSEMMYVFVFANKFMSSYFTRLAKDYIVSTAPKEGVEHLVPKYTLGCKRVIFDTNFLGALHRPNLKLNWDGIQSICEEGIITKKGEKLSFDVLIFATGFTADRYPLHVVGDTNPKTVQDYYDSQGGPKAYLGTAVPGVPNLFMIAGPNTTTGHTSVIFTEELQIDYIIQLVKPILDGLVSSMTVTPRATDAYNDLIHKRLSRSVFMDCISWYRTGGGEGKVSSIFPGPMFLFGWWIRRPKWEDYNVKAATNQWERRVRSEKWMAFLGPMYYLDLLVGLFVSWISG
jgi:cation diffusion facilitator CzcD-associated flavoprotein CzcO